ncbi:MAG: type III polyketide synthase, partial [Sphingomonadales bacterium]|nr:type III polyketide synthase [Sphingomonadales bacterium]
MTIPHIQAIGTAVPTHDIHDAFVDWARANLADPRERKLFARMVDRSQISHRWSVLPPGDDGGTLVMPGGFYHGGMPPTSARMARYAEHAPDLAMEAIAALPDFDPESITHLVAVSCTGFVAPGIDQILARRLGLRPDIERVLIGFMGCYGAVSGLRTARHIIRSEPEARVLVVSVELSTVHLNIETMIEPLLAMLLFGDGAAAALVGAEPRGFAIEEPFSAALPASGELITWH